MATSVSEAGGGCTVSISVSVGDSRGLDGAGGAREGIESFRDVPEDFRDSCGLLADSDVDFGLRLEKSPNKEGGTDAFLLSRLLYSMYSVDVTFLLLGSDPDRC